MRYIESIQNITASPHPFVRPGPFLPSPGQGPNRARAARMEGDEPGTALRPSFFRFGGKQPGSFVEADQR